MCGAKHAFTSHWLHCVFKCRDRRAQGSSDKGSKALSSLESSSVPVVTYTTVRFLGKAGVTHFQDNVCQTPASEEPSSLCPPVKTAFLGQRAGPSRSWAARTYLLTAGEPERGRCAPGCTSHWRGTPHQRCSTTSDVHLFLRDLIRAAFGGEFGTEEHGGGRTTTRPRACRCFC